MVAAQELAFSSKKLRPAFHEHIAKPVLAENVAQTGGIRQESIEHFALRVFVVHRDALERHAALGSNQRRDGPAGTRRLSVATEAHAVEVTQWRQHVGAEQCLVAIAGLETFDVDEHQVFGMFCEHLDLGRCDVVRRKIVRSKIGGNVTTERNLIHPHEQRSAQQQDR